MLGISIAVFSSRMAVTPGTARPLIGLFRPATGLVMAVERFTTRDPGSIAVDGPGRAVMEEVGRAVACSRNRAVGTGGLRVGMVVGRVVGLASVIGLRMDVPGRVVDVANVVGRVVVTLD